MNDSQNTESFRFEEKKKTNSIELFYCLSTLAKCQSYHFDRNFNKINMLDLI